MKIRAIRTRADYEAALARIELLMDATLGTPEGDELDVLVDLAELYEFREYGWVVARTSRAIEP